jgi:hypothetical protein
MDKALRDFKELLKNSVLGIFLSSLRRGTGQRRAP